MKVSHKAARELHEKYVQGSNPEGLVEIQLVLVGVLPPTVLKGGSLKADRVYLSSRALKHLYDSRTAEHYDAIIQHLQDIVQYPDKVYQNKPGKRATHNFVKQIGGYQYLCALELIRAEDDANNREVRFEVATVFRFGEESYLSGCKLLWTGGTPSSSS